MAEAETGSPGESASCPGADDPVAAAREWLLRNGVSLVEPATTGPRGAASGAGSPLTRTALTPASEAAGRGGEEAQLGIAQQSEPVEPQEPSDLSRSAVTTRRRGGGRQRRVVDGEASDTEPQPEADPESVARTIVLRKLAAQARTRHELAVALAARDVPAEVAGKVLDRMETVGLVDDVAFAHDWVASRQQRRHLSRSALRQELQRKGLDRELVEEAVGEVDRTDELEAARDLAERKLRSMTSLPREVQYRRLAGALARRGFGAGVAGPVLAEVLAEAAGD